MAVAVNGIFILDLPTQDRTSRAGSVSSTLTVDISDEEVQILIQKDNRVSSAGKCCSFLRIFCCCTSGIDQETLSKKEKKRHMDFLKKKFENIQDSSGTSYNDFIIEKTAEITNIPLDTYWTASTCRRFLRKANDLSKIVVRIDNLLKWNILYQLSHDAHTGVEIESSTRNKSQDSPYSRSKPIMVHETRFSEEKAVNRLKKIPMQIKETDAEETEDPTPPEPNLLRDVVQQAHKKIISGGYFANYEPMTVFSAIAKELKTKNIVVSQPQLKHMLKDRILTPILSQINPKYMYVRNLEAEELKIFLSEWKKKDNQPLLDQLKAVEAPTIEV